MIWLAPAGSPSGARARVVTMSPPLAVQTYNAESNPHMLAINVEMGFRPYIAYGVWQGPADAARASV